MAHGTCLSYISPVNSVYKINNINGKGKQKQYIASHLLTLHVSSNSGSLSETSQEHGTITSTSGSGSGSP